MPDKRKSRGAVQLPKGVHRVASRGRDYFYFQPGRGTASTGERIRLPDDPQSPEFWAAIQQAKGPTTKSVVITMNHVFDKYLQWLMGRQDVSGETKRKYERTLDIGRAGIGHMPAHAVLPRDVRTLLDQFSDVPGTANNLLGTLRGVSSWGLERGHFTQSFTQAVKPFRSEGGHKPWTAGQCLAAERGLTDMVRRAYFLARYTGQRGSDVVRIGPHMIDDGGFRLTQQKTGREVWCPIEPELAAEMASWEKRLGPYLHQHFSTVNRPVATLGPYTRKLLDSQFRKQTDGIPELKGATFHGLRCTRVVDLRQCGATTTQIQDQVGMSLQHIERYCRFADKKANGKAAVIALRRERG